MQMDPVLTPVMALRDELKIPARQRMEPGASPAHVGTDHLDQELLTAWSNAFAERFVLTARTEVTDRMLIVSERHLRSALDGYVAHYNCHRPHRARNLRPPDSDEITVAAITDLTTAAIGRRRVLGGLINEYQRAA
jgi:putative transposase